MRKGNFLHYNHTLKTENYFQSKQQDKFWHWHFVPSYASVYICMPLNMTEKIAINSVSILLAHQVSLHNGHCLQEYAIIQQAQ